MAANFDEAKQRVLCFAAVLSKANSASELRALMQADTAAPYHSYDMLALLTAAENIGCDIAECMSEGLDFDGAPL